MRTLGAPLTAAQKATAREPQIAVVAENSIAGVRRLNFATAVDTTARNIADHGIAVPADGSTCRIRMATAGGGGDLLYQRSAGGPYTTWTTVLVADASCGVVCAIAAKGARVAVVYTDAAGTGIKLKESTDSGATFGGEIAVTTAPAAVGCIAVAYKNSTGDLGIFWASAAGNAARGIIRTAGAFAAAFNSGAIANAIDGIALVYGFDWDLLLTGTQTTNLRSTLWSLIYGDGNDQPAATWSALRRQLEAETAAAVTFSKPFLCFSDTYRATYMEADAFTGGSTRAYHAQLHPSNTYAAGEFSWFMRGPVSYGSGAGATYAGIEGLAIAATPGAAGSVWLSAADLLTAAPQSQVLETMTTRLLALDLDEKPLGSTGWLDFDNADGSLARETSIDAPLTIGNLMAISPGYYTTSGYVASRMCDWWVTKMEHRRAGGRSVLRVFVADCWYWLDATRFRTALEYAAGTLSYLALLSLAAGRAGMLLGASSASSRSTTVQPRFSVATTESQGDVVRRVLRYLADRVRSAPLASMTMTEPLAGAATQYTLGTDHPIGDFTMAIAVERVSQQQTLGASAFGEAFDLQLATQNIGTTQQLRDLNSSTAPTAAATAVAALRQNELDTPAGVIEMQPHCGLELLDVLDVSDPLVSAAALTFRVRGVRWLYNREKGAAHFRQVVTLGVV